MVDYFDLLGTAENDIIASCTNNCVSATAIYLF